MMLAVGYSEVLLQMALKHGCGTVYNKPTLKRSFIECINPSISYFMRTYCEAHKDYILESMECHENLLFRVQKGTRVFPRYGLERREEVDKGCRGPLESQ